MLWIITPNCQCWTSLGTRIAARFKPKSFTTMGKSCRYHHCRRCYCLHHYIRIISLFTIPIPMNTSLLYPPFYFHLYLCTSNATSIPISPTRYPLYQYHPGHCHSDTTIVSIAPHLYCLLYWLFTSITEFFLVSMLISQYPCHFRGIHWVSATATTTTVSVLLLMYPLH